MEVITDQAACPAPAEGSVVTIGAYDGVHLGHQALIAEVRRLAAARGCHTAVVTFDRHPATVVRPESAPRLLTDLEQKLELLAAAGVDYTLVIHFDEARSQESADDFVSEVLAGCLRARVVVVGEDFHFGRQRGGNVELLRRMGPGLGFDVVGLGLIEVPGVEGPVSSTAIRHALVAGEVERAAMLLGRPYEVRGAVERGGEVSVPAEILLPAEGIYEGWYGRAAGEAHSAAIRVDGTSLSVRLREGGLGSSGTRARVGFAGRLQSGRWVG